MAELQKKRSGFERFIHGVEVVGNKLPHPFWLFIYLSIIVLVLSYFLSKAGVSVTYMSAGKAGADAKETTVAVVNLFSYEALRKYFANFVPIYTSFAPLGLIMTMTLGIALLEQSGLISAFMRKAILGAPSWAITATLAVVGINANLASDAGIIFTPAIGGAIFKALGRNPWVGIATGFAAGCGILDGSDWLREAIGLSLPCDAQGVLTAEDAAFSETYVRDGRFLPDALGLPVLGTYREQGVPSVISNAGFLYPLSMSGAKDGMYFTDGADTSGLTALFESRGYTVTDQRQRLSLPALAAKLLTDSVLSRAISAAMLGLIFCFSYVVLTMYRENDRRYQIYHLFGLSKARLFLRSTLTAMGIALTAALLFGVVLYRGLTYMPDSDLTTLLIGTTVGFVLFSLILNWAGYCGTAARLGKGGR